MAHANVRYSDSYSVSKLNGLIGWVGESGMKHVAALTTTSLHAQGIFVACKVSCT